MPVFDIMKSHPHIWMRINNYVTSSKTLILIGSKNESIKTRVYRDTD